MKSFYTYEIKNVYDTDFISIIDLDEGRSVTNHIDEIVQNISEIEGIELAVSEGISVSTRIDLSNHLVIYRDTEGRWDGYDYKTKQFYSLNAMDEDLAIRKAIEHEIIQKKRLS